MRPWRTRLIAPITLSMVLGAALVAGTAGPGYAQPGEVPDPGARPAPAGDLPLPDGSFARPPSASERLTGPLAAEIATVQLEVDTKTTELRAVQPQVAPAQAEAVRAEQEWQTVRDELAAAQTRLDQLVGDSYRGAAALPEQLYIPELPGLTAHAPVPVEAPLGVAAAARELVEQRAAEQAAAERYRTAQLTGAELAQRQDRLESELATLTARLERLQERNTELLIAAERAREEAAQDRSFPITQPVAGHRAGPDAVAAVRFALRQRGKPYEWGAEGPDRYDCSGLVWAAYRSVGRSLPRVAADQYWGTRLRTVARTAAVAQQGLLPGDLVFFSYGPSWQSVHHVGMYIGSGYMVHAPNRNEVVKVSQVWWTGFFAATRVVEAVPVASPSSPPPSTGDPDPGTGPDPTPTDGAVRPTDPTDPTDPGPDETSSPDPDPTDSPSPTPTESSPAPVTVPDLSGMTVDEAREAVERLGLEFVEGQPVTNGSCGIADEVVQTPEPGVEVEAGSPVTYQICEPPATATPSATPTSTPLMSSSPNPTASASPTAG